MNRIVIATALSSLLIGAGCSQSSAPKTTVGTGGRGAAGTGGGTGAPAGSGGVGAVSSGGAPGSGGAPTGSGGAAVSSSGGTSAGGASPAGQAGATSSSGGTTAVGSGGAAGGPGGAGAGGPSAGGGSAGTGPSATGGMTVACQAPLPVTGTAATVTIDGSATPIATVGPDLMGIHTAVYDSSMQLPTTPDLLKAVGVTSLRYPGGSYADSYHWESHTATFVPTSNSDNNTIYVAPDADFGHFVSLLKNVGANAMITVNYGMNSDATGPGTPQAAAAWVAYANGLPTNTTAIGADAGGKDWKTVGYWASLRAADPLPVDDTLNFLRISHPAPVGIKNWEVGNELYGNGYYYGGCGWEPDMHLPYPSLAPLTACNNRQNNPALSPAAYGTVVKAFATAMKAADPTIKVGGIVHWPYNEYADWNRSMLPQACASIDFVVNHWYAGSTLANLLTSPHTDIPMMFKDLRTALTTASNGCGAKGATMPLAVTEWGPNTNNDGDLKSALSPPSGTAVTHTQLPGIFAADAYANFMEQGALSVHWLELHNASYLGGDDTPSWGYHGAQMAHALAAVGDALIPATITGAAATSLQPHASKHADGSLSVMLTNTSPSVTAAVTINVTGGALACVGTRTAYAPVMTDMDGAVASAPIFAAANGASVQVAVPPYSVVVVAFPKK